MFADIDRMDADAWAAYLAPDAVMRFVLTGTAGHITVAAPRRRRHR